MHQINRPRIPALTGLRFFAAMLVVVSHFTVPGSTGRATEFQNSGYGGVTVFFVLSGFVIAYNYLDEFCSGRSVGHWWDYAVARFARIYPLYFFFILYAWMMNGGGDARLHFLAIQAWSPNVFDAYGFIGPAWSVGVEVFLYATFPFLVFAIDRIGLLTSLRRLVIAGGLVIAAMLALTIWFSAANSLPITDPGSAHRWLYRMPLTRLGDFLLGMFGAIYVMRFYRSTSVSQQRWAMVGLLALVAIPCVMATPQLYRSVWSWDIAFALPAAVLILALAVNRDTRLSRLLGSQPMVLLGEASFALYLVHEPAHRLYVSAPEGSVLALPLYFAFLFLLVALSIGLHIALERPARRWLLAVSGRAKTLLFDRSAGAS